MNSSETPKDPICPQCGYPIKAWARIQCNNCGRTFCRGHKPAEFDFSKRPVVRITTWYCNDCVNKMKGFAPPTQQPSKP